MNAQHNPLIDEVNAFIDHWNNMDLEAIIAAFDEDIFYHNIPMTPLRGIDAVRDYLQSIWRFQQVNWIMLNISACGDTVLTERIDEFHIDGKLVSLPVMGAFQFKHNKIRQWRDYFDLASYKQQLQA